MTTAASPMKHDGKQMGKAGSVTFEETLMQSAIDMFAATLGKNTTDALFRTFEILQPEIRASGITSVIAFNAALDESFGDFSKSIKKVIIEKICLELGVALDQLSTNDFLSEVAQLKDLLPDL
jgi:hypothetical protein